MKNFKCRYILFCVPNVGFYNKRIYSLKICGFFFFSYKNRVLDLVRKPLMILVGQNIVFLAKLEHILHKFNILSCNFVNKLYLQITEWNSSFPNRIRWTKIIAEFFSKTNLVSKPILINSLLFLIKTNSKPILNDPS